MKSKNQTNPLVSVIMPVYNGAAYLKTALDSVFSQTYAKIEIIAVNDGSIDNSYTILRDIAQSEPRLKIVNCQINKGPAGAANFGIKKARGQFIARMDCDDIMPSNRIAKQVKFLLTHSKVVVVGGQVELITHDEKPIILKKFPSKHNEIIKMSFVAMPIQQGAMMVNKRLLPKNFVWYKNELKTSEDLDFLFRIFKFGKGANLPDIMLYYRQYGVSISQVENPKKIYLQAFKIRKNALDLVTNLSINQRLLVLAKLYLQLLIMLLLPTKLIYPLYYLWRGMVHLKMPKHGILPVLRYAKSYII
jgi:glycosyltransferase involved in cell wall biosynthesis